jgi:hypothetical protein
VYQWSYISIFSHSLLFVWFNSWYVLILAWISVHKCLPNAALEVAGEEEALGEGRRISGRRRRRSARRRTERSRRSGKEEDEARFFVTDNPRFLSQPCQMSCSTICQMRSNTTMRCPAPDLQVHLRQPATISRHLLRYPLADAFPICWVIVTLWNFVQKHVEVYRSLASRSANMITKFKKSPCLEYKLTSIFRILVLEVLFAKTIKIAFLKCLFLCVNGTVFIF